MQALIFIEANGKANAWSRVARTLGMTVKVIPTTGHVCSFPKTLTPIGIDISKKGVLETRRAADPERRDRILAAVSETDPNVPILIATDNDVEGDVIAFDLADMIYRAHKDRIDAIFRVYPGPITARGIRHAINGAVPMASNLDKMVHDAIPGRARAVTDRWIGATFSRIAGVPVGRVRSAILGATFLGIKAPHHLRGRAETGEITFQARSSFGGRPFVARVALNGSETKENIETLSRIARSWAGKLVPGTVRVISSLSAAVAPRIGTVQPFNTADALAYAARHHAIPVKMAMQGLQDAYIQGMVSYPRTSSRVVSIETASRVTMLGSGCGLDGLDPEILGTRLDMTQVLDRTHDGAHEALHPVVAFTTRNTSHMRDLIRRPLREPAQGWDRPSVMEAMTILVARRAFEAARDIVLERGNWSPDNVTRVTQEEEEVLRDLDWVREDGFSFPWTRSFMTSIKEWPLDAVLLETMVIEGLGRPSTYASHVDVAIRSRDIETGEFPEPPRPSPQGMNTLKRTPKSVWNPAVCRLIEDALENADNYLGEDTSAPLPARARHRVMFWLNRIPDDMRTPLLEALKDEVSQRDRSLAGFILKSDGAAIDLDPQASDEVSVSDIPDAVMA